jgi:protein-S-isoprenylcysteine O-methyltransferase Ste14
MREKRRNGGRLAAALDARGAAFGGIGLLGFAFIVWKLLPAWNAVPSLLVAMGVWLAVSILVWRSAKFIISSRAIKPASVACDARACLNRDFWKASCLPGRLLS